MVSAKVIAIIASSSLLVAYVAAFFIIPEWALFALSALQVKIVLAGLFFVFLVCVSILLWWLYHVPPAKRAVAFGQRTLLGFTVGAGFFAGFGWPQVETLILCEDIGFQLEWGGWTVPVNPVWPSMLIGLIGVLAMTALYLYAEALEERGIIRKVD